jgi:RNA polymerase sigma-70 factor, ECF subfamily
MLRRFKNYSDQELVLMLKQGDIKAFDELYFRYIPRLEAFIKVFAKDKVHADEALQEIFIRIWERRESLNETLSFKAFLFQVSKNHVLNILRKKVRELSLDNAPELSVYATNTTEDQLNYFELHEKTLEIIDSLPATQKQIFTLSRVEGLRNDEISARLNIAKRTVEHHIYLALRTIKDKLPLSEITSIIFLLMF